MKILLIENCELCGHCIFDFQEDHECYGEYSCHHPVHGEKKYKLIPAECFYHNNVPIWCPLPDITPDWVDLYYKPRLTKAIAQEALKSGAKIEE